MRIIGINNEMQISSACLIEDGKIIAAAAEERLTRQKRTRDFPAKAIEYCLKEADITIEDVDYVVNSWNPGIYFENFNPIYSGKRRHLVEQLYSVPDHLMGFYGRPQSDYIYQEIVGEFGKSKVYYIPHHRAHAANGFFLSEFNTAAILTADAQGEFESTTFCRGQDNQIELLKTINYPHSLGALYSTITEYLGFRPNSDEWKVMAMASYSDHDNQYYKFMKEEIIKFLPNGEFELNLSYFNGHMHEQPNLYTHKLTQAMGPARLREDPIESKHYRIAAALQKIAEDAAVHLLNYLYDATQEDNLVLSGGVFMNSVFNGKVLKLTPFKNVYISSSPDDSGNCFGAAYYLYNHILGKPRARPMAHNYYGPSYSIEEVRKVVEGSGLNFEFKEDISEVCSATARFLAEGKIVGWFQGRMEFGQRALGNRSILADPRREEMKNRVNMAVKFREKFRPFAPAILKERQQEYFEMPPHTDVCFMERVFPIKKEKQAEIPAVVHVNGTGRIQTVSRKTNPLFHSLITEFEKETGVPVVLNTSFNLNGEPIVCAPKDAIRTFYSCGLDILVMENFIIYKGDKCK
jgi:carbamoyltransferase